VKIKQIKLKGFRRFKNLTIKDIPEEARLVVMIGPNGSGKSSVFDALLRFRYTSGQILGWVPDSYLIKFDLSEEAFEEPEFEEPEIEESEIQEPGFEEPEVEFHTDAPNNTDAFRRSVHMRSAYRNDALDSSHRYLSKTNPLIQELRFRRLAENDQTVALNYDRILGPWIERMSARKKTGETPDEIENDLYGELRDAIRELFKDPQLTLTGLGNPKNQKIFEFDKGTSQGFSYENLSSGEKAALDLVLDIIVAKSEFNNTVFCIDEPEAHMHTKLQGPLLGQLYKIIPENSQLWIATHSIGMVRKAQDLWRDGKNTGKDSVVFLDFGDEKLDFDDDATITPTLPNPDLWARTYEIALGDLAKLVAPKRIILCESAGFDADCYNKIFGVHYPETRFIPIGSDQDVEKADENLIPVIQAVAEGAEILRLRDRDDADKAEIEENKEKGIRTLLRRNIESYLLDDEVLTKFCEYHNIPDQIQNLIEARQAALKDSIANGKPHDDLKPTAQRVHITARNALSPTPVGNKKIGFMKNHLTPRIQPGMDVYKKLHDIIFGE